MKATTFSTISTLLGLAVASPMVVSNNHPILKRQEFGAVEGLPAELAAAIPTLAKSGMLPSVVKSAINAGYGKIAPDVAGQDAGVAIEQTSRNPQIPNSKTVKVRYGPYTVPNMMKKNFLGEAGALFNYPDTDVLKPCAGDCTLLGMNADLEYKDGSNANIGNGMWLHHMVLFNVGPNRMDPTCVGKMSLPHILIGSDPGHSERLIASGNERSQTRFNSPYTPNARLGYFLRPADQFRLIVDFMNENKEDKTVYMTITYDYVEGHPKEFEEFKSIWFDAAQCGTSEVAPPQGKTKFTIGPVDWVANLDAEIMGAGGHLHDGGESVILTVDGKVICDSEATYGVTAANGTVKVGGMGGMGGGMKAGSGSMGAMTRVQNGLSRMVAHGGPEPGAMGAMGDVTKQEHIVAMSPCYGKTIGLTHIKKGQKWSITGTYDYDKHAGMAEDGKQSNVMAIAMMFVKSPTF